MVARRGSRQSMLGPTVGNLGLGDRTTSWFGVAARVRPSIFALSCSPPRVWFGHDQYLGTSSPPMARRRLTDLAVHGEFRCRPAPTPCRPGYGAHASAGGAVQWVAPRAVAAGRIWCSGRLAPDEATHEAVRRAWASHGTVRCTAAMASARPACCSWSDAFRHHREPCQAGGMRSSRPLRRL
jgi:hypothetical protein